MNPTREWSPELEKVAQPVATAGKESSLPLDDPRVIQAVREYLAALEAGKKPDRISFLGRFPEIAGPLAECLDALEFMHFSLTAPTSATAGSGFSVTVTALNSSNNIATGYTGTVHFSSTDSQSVLPAGYTFTAGDAGLHTFTGVTLKTAGSQSVTATDTVTSTITGSDSLKVNPAAASKLVVSGYPSPTTVGISHNFTVTARDSFGNTATDYSGTVAFTSSDSKAVLPARYSFTSTDAGVHSFTATMMTPGTQTLDATDIANGTLAGAETGINVVTATVQAVLAGPTSGVRGQPLAFSLGASESGLSASSVFSYSIQWGDGSALQTVTGPTGTLVNHIFAGDGIFTVGVTAADSTGNASSSVSQLESITAIALQVDPANSSQTALVVGGTIGDDTIVFSPANSQGGIKVVINCVNQGTFTPTGHIIAYGQSGNDTIRETSQKIRGKTVYVNMPALLFAGNDTDTLDVSGSTAGNVLVGGTGNDTLIGGKGHDILIGGSGTDTLRAGSGGDILIGGTTAYDTNAAALAAVLAEWSRTDIDYVTRIAHLTGNLTGNLTGGLNGGYLLNTSAVQGNSLADNLYGGAGMDWFFAGMADLLFNTTTGEVVTPI